MGTEALKADLAKLINSLAKSASYTTVFPEPYGSRC
jgi:hypothetical protein